ncbi:MAG: flagellar hook-basal body complex protein, partial [Lachnospiraceae bacterium]|nr:flagellar hook-basal body complex protein [Lachnospiraceae bacterium]
MMRSLYSAVSGLKTHQTKMDVIGNNISNVNTVAFKSSSVVFNSIMYQTISSASGANDSTGVGGVNAKQIGLGVNTGSTTMSITSAGASETTGNPFDLKITDKSTSSFFIVDSGAEKLFTKAGSFYVDGAGNLCMTSTGYTVQGWQVDPTTAQIRKDTVSSLKIMSPENQTSSPEATTKATCAGVVDNNSVTMNTDQGYSMNLLIYDDLGYQYTARFAIQAVDAKNGKYAVNLTDIMSNKADGTTESILNKNVNLQQLFGSSTYQGSVVDITANYKATGSAGADLKKIVINNAVSVGKAAADNPDDATPLYMYYWDADDINNYLGISGSSKRLPDGYKLRFPGTDEEKKYTDDSTITTVKGLSDVMNGSTSTDASGNVTNNPPTAVLDILDASGAKVGTATRNLDAGGTWVLEYTDGKSITDFVLYNTVSVDDFVSDGSLVSEVDPATSCYRFKGSQVDALAEHL